MAADCIFCQIIAGKIPTKFVHQDELVVAFPDIHPVAPTHILIIPRKHIYSMAEVTPADLPIITRMMEVAVELAKREGISQTGFRLTINNGKQADQIVPHLHMHLIGGRQLSGSIG